MTYMMLRAMSRRRMLLLRTVAAAAIAGLWPSVIAEFRYVRITKYISMNRTGMKSTG
jgi:hypothetical protein